MRRAFSILLACILIAPGVPLSAFAEEESVEPFPSVETPLPDPDPGEPVPEVEDQKEDALFDVTPMTEPATFVGIGQDNGDSHSDHLGSGGAYLGQFGIRFSAPVTVHYIVVYPDTDNPHFINCADTAYAAGTLNVSFGETMPPWSGHLFTPVHTAPRPDGGCVYYRTSGVFVHPGTTYNFTLNSVIRIERRDRICRFRKSGG